MVYTAKHTSRTNNKNASKVVSGVLLTTSVLAGMAMAQDNNASADTIDTPTTTQQAQPVAQNQSKTQSDVQDQAQSTQEQSATSEVKTVASDSSTPVQKTAATTQDSTVVKEDVQADENTTKVTSAEDQAPKEDVTNETKAAQPKQSVTPQKKVGSDVKEKITTKVKGSEETNDPVDWSYDTWKLSDAEDYANYVIKWAGTQYEDQSAIRELQSKLNDVDAYWNGDEDYDDDTQKAITDKLAQDLQNLSASIYSNLEHSNIPNPQQAPINSKELQGVLDYANEIKAWAKNADFSDSVLNDPQSKLSGLYFAYYRTFTDLNGPMTTNYWYVMHFANDPYDTSSSQDEVNNYKDGLLSQLNELISMLEDNNIPKPDNNSGSDDNKGNNDNNSGSDDNKGNSDNNSDSDDNNGNNDNNSGSNDNKGNNDSNSSSDTNKGSSDNHQNSGNANNSSKDNSNSSNGIAQNDNHGNSNSGSNATGSSNAGSTESTKTTQNGSESLKNVSVTTPAEVAKKAQMSTSSSNQSESKTLPQTGDKSQTSSVWAGIVGIIIAGFGFLGFSKRKHG